MEQIPIHKAFLIGTSLREPSNDYKAKGITPKTCSLNIKGNLNSDKDINLMKKFLKSRAIELDDANIVLGAKDPTREILLKKLSAFFEKGDFWMIYYTGHGQEKTGAWCLETDVDCWEVVSPDDILTVWNNRPVKKKGDGLLLIVDSCYSGFWVDALSEKKIDDVFLQSSCGNEPCSQNLTSFFTDAMTRNEHLHKKYRSASASIWNSITSPFTTYQLAQTNDEPDGEVFKSFPKEHNFTPKATHHGQVPIGKGIHIGPSGCWSGCDAKFAKYLNSIASDEPGLIQFTKAREEARKIG